jgi:DNA-binding NarL/FixJ family response regulator
VTVDDISVLVVDDHAIFADALQARLAQEPGIGPVRTAYSAAHGRVLIDQDPPRVLLLDLALGADDGLELADYVRAAHPYCQPLMLTGVESTADVVSGLRRGVRGWLPKTIDVGDLVRAVRGVAQGEAWLSPALLGAVLPDLVAAPAPAPPDPLAVLTAREREVLQCLVDGLSRAQIAMRLHVSANTVRTHTQNLLAKLGAHSTLESVALALRHGVRATGS